MTFPAEKEPDGDVMAPHHFWIGIGLAVFGFLFTWPYYPETGATITLVGTLLIVDDVISHVFGVWTPADWLWKKYLYPKLAR